MEHAETAEKYEHESFAAGGKREGLTRDEPRDVDGAFRVPTILE
ncbi:hypothetical protein [Deinococcus yavapaiensis]|nr:hypothetical protein [Deinococcus yavapaiensis]